MASSCVGCQPVRYSTAARCLVRGWRLKYCDSSLSPQFLFMNTDSSLNGMGYISHIVVAIVNTRIHAKRVEAFHNNFTPSSFFA